MGEEARTENQECSPRRAARGIGDRLTAGQQLAHPLGESGGAGAG